MTIPFSAYVLIPIFVLLACLFRRDLLALAIASSVLQAASILDLNIGGSDFGVPIWIPLLAISCLADLEKGATPRRERRPAGLTTANTRALLSFTIYFLYSLFSAFTMPFLFDGTHFESALSPRHSSDFSLHFSATNMAQSGYTILSAIVFYRCAFERSAKSKQRITDFYVNACAASALIGIYQVISQPLGLYFPSSVLYSNETHTQLFGDAVAGVYRLNATFTEASMAALFFAGSFGIVLARVASHKPKISDALKCLLFAVALVLTFSTTAYVVLLLGIAWFTIKTARESLNSRRAAIAGMSALVITALAAFLVQTLATRETVEKITNGVLLEKSQSASYSERHGADLAALDLFLSTSFLGAGLGSCRASSALAELLGNIGIIGTAALCLCIYSIFTAKNGPGARSTARPRLLLGCTLMLVSYALAVPDIVYPAIWAVLGLLAQPDHAANPDQQTPRSLCLMTKVIDKPITTLA